MGFDIHRWGFFKYKSVPLLDMVYFFSFSYPWLATAKAGKYIGGVCRELPNHRVSLPIAVTSLSAW
jgi:hypothetical protein